MSEPIKIVVNAQTAEAAAAMSAFTKTTGDGLKEVAGHAHAATGIFAENRMAMMEMEHSARAMADGLMAGINPLRMLAMEGPRLLQASTVMTDAFKATLMSYLPLLGGIAAAVGAGAIAWKFYGESLTDPTKRARDMADALEKIPRILDKIAIAQRAGAIDPARAEKYKDLLSGKTPLYNETTVADSFGGHARTVRNGLGGFFGEEFPQLTTDPNLRNSRTGRVVGQRQPANQADIEKYVTQLMRSDKTTMANDDSNPGNEALAKLHEQELKIQRDAEVGTQQEIARIRDRYERERREIGETRDVAVAAHKWTADEEKKYQDTLAASKRDETASIAEIEQRVADEKARKAQEEETKRVEALRKFEAEQKRMFEEVEAAQKKADEELEKQDGLHREITDETIRLKIAQTMGRDYLYFCLLFCIKEGLCCILYAKSG